MALASTCVHIYLNMRLKEPGGRHPVVGGYTYISCSESTPHIKVLGNDKIDR